MGTTPKQTQIKPSTSSLFSNKDIPKRPADDLNSNDNGKSGYGSIDRSPCHTHDHQQHEINEPKTVDLSRFVRPISFKNVNKTIFYYIITIF